MRLTSLIAVLSLSILACGRSDDTTPDGQGSGSGSGNTVTIQQVQSDTMLPGTAVALGNVVVTAIDEFGAKTSDIWVEEMGGGKRSGVHVFKAANADVMMLTIGDVINLKGAIKSEFALTGSNADNSGRTVTELEPASGGAIVITKTGQTATITPDKVDALAIGQMYDSTMSATGGGPAFSDAWEDWEGVLIELDNVAAAGQAKPFGKTTPVPADSYSFGITGVAKVEGSLTDITMSNIARGTCFGNMTGVVDYFYDYLVFPRSAADFNTSGTACPALEQAAGTDGSKCTDGMDNDGNGFTDCQDLGCEAGSGAWLGATCTAGAAMCGCSVNLASTTSVHSVDTTYAATSSPVMLRDVYITVIPANVLTPTQYWVADSLTAVANGGVLVFSSPPAGATVGQKISTLQGVAGPFGNGTLQTLEVSSATAGTLAGTGLVVPLPGIATDTLSGATTGAPYNGSVVILSKAKVTAVANTFGEVELTDGNGKKIMMDDEAFKFYGGTLATPTPPAMSACLIVTGVMEANTNDLTRTINPRGATDIVTATGCP